MEPKIITTREEITAALANFKQTTRKVNAADIETMFATIAEHDANPKAVAIRVYANDAFVPNSYKWRCETVCLSAHRTDDGWVIAPAKVDAHRSRAQGAKVTVNNRPA